MPCLVVCIRRNPDLTPEQFSHHWREVHAPLIRGCPPFAKHLRLYSQYHPSLDDGSAEGMFGGTGGFDGLAVLEFDTIEAMNAAFSEPDYLSQVQPDEARFIDLDACLSFVTERFDVVSH